MYCSKHFSGLTPQSLKFIEIIIDNNKDLKNSFPTSQKTYRTSFWRLNRGLLWEWYETHKYDVWAK